MKTRRLAIFEVYPVAKLGWVWRIKRGARILAHSTQSYQRRRAAVRAIRNLVIEGLDKKNIPIEIREKL